MELGRVSNGERIAALSAVLLFVFVFFDWFGLKHSGELHLFRVGHCAREAFDYISIVFAAAIIATLGVVALRLVGTAYQHSV